MGETLNENLARTDSCPKTQASQHRALAVNTSQLKAKHKPECQIQSVENFQIEDTLSALPATISFHTGSTRNPAWTWLE